MLQKLHQSLIYLSVLALFSACYSDQPVDVVAQRFQHNYQAYFLEGLPVVSTLSTVRPRLDSLALYRELLTAVDTHALSTAGRTRRLLLLRQLDNERERWMPYRINPARYNLAGLLKQQLADPALSERKKLKNLVSLMDQANSYYASARENLVSGEVDLFRLASQKQYLGLEFLLGELQDSLRSFGLRPGEKDEVDKKVQSTYLALKDYLAFCESVFINGRDSTHYAYREKQVHE